MCFVSIYPLSCCRFNSQSVSDIAQILTCSCRTLFISPLPRSFNAVNRSVLCMPFLRQRGESHQPEIGSEFWQAHADAFVHPSATSLAIHTRARETGPTLCHPPLHGSESAPIHISVCNALLEHGSYLLDLHSIRGSSASRELSTPSCSRYAAAQLSSTTVGPCGTLPGKAGVQLVSKASPPQPSRAVFTRPCAMQTVSMRLCSRRHVQRCVWCSAGEKLEVSKCLGCIDLNAPFRTASE